ncbi:MAG TPA: hypothetical protein VK787_00435 [Puia sp.]|jgi:hypothetical protein|nr:hypothetical protein [Puia sp.]
MTETKIYCEIKYEHLSNSAQVKITEIENEVIPKYKRVSIREKKANQPRIEVLTVETIIVEPTVKRKKKSKTWITDGIEYHMEWLEGEIIFDVEDISDFVKQKTQELNTTRLNP